MSKISLNLKYGKELFENVICNPNNLPFSFNYDGTNYTKASNFELVTTENEIEITKTYTYIIDNTIQVTYNVKFNKEFAQSEYVVYFKNISDKPSKVISNILASNLYLEGINPLVRGNLGDLVKYYEAYERKLNHEDVYFKQDDGRTSHIVFPYFDLCYGKGGLLIALGWGGTWDALFTCEDDITNFTAKTCLNLKGCLLPDETIRTGLIVLLPYRGRNADNATNLWREWFMKYNAPTNKPFSTVMFANDTGKPNSDGSISECYTTWRPTIEKLVKENVITDFRWIDAGWYFSPDNQTVISDWWGSVGCWEVDKVKWPDKTFKEATDYCHSINMKSVLWFEPERVTHIEDLVKNYGYNKEWAYETPYVFYNNIGNEKCREWTLNRIIKMMDENGIDMYREDNNSIPIHSYNKVDSVEEKLYNMPRKGINENKCVQGHYKLWDDIISYCKANNKCGFVDSCAGGGGRNDIESLRRGVPLMRSDLDRGTSSMRLSQTSTLCKWIVFHGSSTKESDASYRLFETKGPTSYVARASYLPIYNIHEAFTHNPNLDYDLLRKNMNEWKEISPFLIKDYYLLTPYHHSSNNKSWTVFCYDDNKTHESILLGFRMDNAKKDTYMAKLPFVNNKDNYQILEVDTNNIEILSGQQIKKIGIKIKLENPKSSVLLKIKKI